MQVHMKHKFPEVGYLDVFIILINFAKMPFWGPIPIYICMCESTLWEHVRKHCFLTEMPTECIIKLLDFFFARMVRNGIRAVFLIFISLEWVWAAFHMFRSHLYLLFWGLSAHILCLCLLDYWIVGPFNDFPGILSREMTLCVWSELPLFSSTLSFVLWLDL